MRPRRRDVRQLEFPSDLRAATMRGSHCPLCDRFPPVPRNFSSPGSAGVLGASGNALEERFTEPGACNLVISPDDPVVLDAVAMVEFVRQLLVEQLLDSEGDACLRRAHNFRCHAATQGPCADVAGASDVAEAAACQLSLLLAGPIRDSPRLRVLHAAVAVLTAHPSLEMAFSCCASPELLGRLANVTLARMASWECRLAAAWLLELGVGGPLTTFPDRDGSATRTDKSLHISAELLSPITPYSSESPTARGAGGGRVLLSNRRNDSAGLLPCALPCTPAPPADSPVTPATNYWDAWGARIVLELLLILYGDTHCDDPTAAHGLSPVRSLHSPRPFDSVPTSSTAREAAHYASCYPGLLQCAFGVNDCSSTVGATASQRRPYAVATTPRPVEQALWAFIHCSCRLIGKLHLLQIHSQPNGTDCCGHSEVLDVLSMCLLVCGLRLLSTPPRSPRSCTLLERDCLRTGAAVFADEACTLLYAGFITALSCLGVNTGAPAAAEAAAADEDATMLLIDASRASSSTQLPKAATMTSVEPLGHELSCGRVFKATLAQVLLQLRLSAGSSLNDLTRAPLQLTLLAAAGRLFDLATEAGGGLDLAPLTAAADVLVHSMDVHIVAVAGHLLLSASPGNGSSLSDFVPAASMLVARNGERTAAAARIERCHEHTHDQATRAAETALSEVSTHAAAIRALEERHVAAFAALSSESRVLREQLEHVHVALGNRESELVAAASAAASLRYVNATLAAQLSQSRSELRATRDEIAKLQRRCGDLTSALDDESRRRVGDTAVSAERLDDVQRELLEARELCRRQADELAAATRRAEAAEAAMAAAAAAAAAAATVAPAPAGAPLRLWPRVLAPGSGAPPQSAPRSHSPPRAVLTREPGALSSPGDTPPRRRTRFSLSVLESDTAAGAWWPAAAALGGGSQLPLASPLHASSRVAAAVAASAAAGEGGAGGPLSILSSSAISGSSAGSGDSSGARIIEGQGQGETLAAVSRAVLLQPHHPWSINSSGLGVPPRRVSWAPSTLAAADFAAAAADALPSLTPALTSEGAGPAGAAAAETLQIQRTFAGGGGGGEEDDGGGPGGGCDDDWGGRGSNDGSAGPVSPDENGAGVVGALRASGGARKPLHLPCSLAMTSTACGPPAPPPPPPPAAAAAAPLRKGPRPGLRKRGAATSALQQPPPPRGLVSPPFDPLACTHVTTPGGGREEAIDEDDAAGAAVAVAFAAGSPAVLGFLRRGRQAVGSGGAGRSRGGGGLKQRAVPQAAEGRQQLQMHAAAPPAVASAAAPGGEQRAGFL